MPPASPRAQLTQAAGGELLTRMIQRIPGRIDLPAAQPRRPEGEPQQANSPVLGLRARGGLRLLGRRPALSQQARIGSGLA